MLKILPLTDFGASGISSDGPWSTSADYLSDGRNFRIQNGQILSNNGLSKWYYQPSFGGTGEMLPVGTLAQGMYLICATNGIYSFDGQTHSLLNKIVVQDSVSWSSCMNGSIPVINHPEVGAFYWYPIGHGVPLKPLPFDKTKNWDTKLGKSGKIIRSHKNYMFMLNITEVLNGTTQVIQDGYHWSHPSDINSVPPSWDENDKNFLSGIAQIGGNTGAIVDGLSLRDSFVIYSEHGINLLQESGDVFVWNRTPVTSTTGPIADACVVEVEGAHFILCPDDLLMFDGNSLKSIAQGKIRDFYRSYIAQKDYRTSYAFKVTATKEIWFCVPGHGVQYPNLAFIYNWVEGSWSTRELPENLTYAVYGPRSRGITLWKTLKEQVPPPEWQTFDAPWGNDTYNPFDQTVVGVRTDGMVLDCDSQFIGVDSLQGPISFILRENLPFEGLATFTTIVAAYPKISGAGDVKITIGSQDYPGSDIRWQAPVLFKPGAQRRINVRSTGALHAFKVESVGMGQFTMSGIDFEYAPAGRR